MNATLSDTLRQLRLSGLAHSLEVRLQEAAGHALSHAEFLELILQDQVLVRQQRAGSLDASKPPRSESTRPWRTLIGASTPRSSARRCTTWRLGTSSATRVTCCWSARRAWANRTWLKPSGTKAEIIAINGKSYRLKDRACRATKEKV